MNFCRACRQDFGSVKAFEAHRIGTHAYTFAEGLENGVEDGRRCRDDGELIAAGFVRNARGRWSLGRDLERARGLNPGLESEAA